MRTNQEILDRIEAIKAGDFFGTQINDLANRLSFEAAKHLLEDDATVDSWGDVSPRDHESVKAEMLEYMKFAWDKANNNRGLSAARSLDHMKAWLWLLGMDEAAVQMDNYDLYGKPQLRAICEYFGWDWRQWDDGRWTNSECSDGHSAPETVTPLAA